MAQKAASKLDAGDAFPDFPIHLDGSPTTIKAAVAGTWSVLFLYRGRW